MGKEKLKTERIDIRITAEQKRMLERLARYDRNSISGYLTRLIEHEHSAFLNYCSTNNMDPDTLQRRFCVYK